VPLVQRYVSQTASRPADGRLYGKVEQDRDGELQIISRSLKSSRHYEEGGATKPKKRPPHR